MKKIFPGLLIVLILIINIYRCIDLKSVPAGYHVDEYSAAVTIRCFALEGTNAWGKKDGAFFTVAYGSPRPATYIWPAAFWGKIFDYRVPTLRAFSVAVILFGITGIFALGWRVGGLYAGLWAALSASLSPHIFVLSRIAFESTFAAAFFAWGLFFLLKTNCTKSVVAASFFMALSCYSYPPARLFIPLFLVLFFLTHRGWRFGLRPWLIFVGATTLFSFPIIHAILTNEMVTRRFSEISIFAAINAEALSFRWIKGVLVLFFHNVGLHLTPEFLFTKGDASSVHSTTGHGLFSWLDYVAWIFGFLLLLWQHIKKEAHKYFKDQGNIILLCVLGFFLSLIPSSLTNSEIPNALRISLSWPLVSLLTGILITQVHMQWRWFSSIALVFACLFAYHFLHFYFTVYPKESIKMFHDWVVRDGLSINKKISLLEFLLKYRYKDFHTRYFLMNELDKSCVESYRIWENVYNNTGKGKRY